MLFDGAALHGPHPQTYFSKSKHVAVTVSAMPVTQHWRMWRAWSVMRTATARSSQRARSIAGEAMSKVISATLTPPPVPFRSAWRVSVVPAHSASEELDWRRKLSGVSTVVPGGGRSEGFEMCALTEIGERGPLGQRLAQSALRWSLQLAVCWAWGERHARSGSRALRREGVDLSINGVRANEYLPRQRVAECVPDHVVAPRKSQGPIPNARPRRNLLRRHGEPRRTPFGSWRPNGSRRLLGRELHPP